MQYKLGKYLSLSLLALSVASTSPLFSAEYAPISEKQIIAGEASSEESLGEILSVSQDGKLMVVGIDDYQNGRDKVGAIRLFKKNETTKQWDFFTTIVSVHEQSDFGFSVAINPIVNNGEYSIAVGAYSKSTGSGYPNSEQGAVYLYSGSLQDSASDWKNSEIELLANNRDYGDYFGYTVAIYGDTLAVGAPEEDSSENSTPANPIYAFPTQDGGSDNDDFSSSGAVYLFKKQGSLWTEHAYVKAPDNKSIGAGWRAKKYDGHFGRTITMTDNKLVIGAPELTHYDGSGTKITDWYRGAVYIFQKDATSTFGWKYTGTKLTMDKTGDPSYSRAYFGDSLATSANNTVVGLTGRYATYGRFAFVYDNNDFSTFQKIKGNETDSQDRFGKSIVATDDTIVIGSPEEDGLATIIDGDETNLATGFDGEVGAAYLFVKNQNGEWEQKHYIKASKNTFDQEFGRTVAVAGDSVFIGAPGNINMDGEVYVFERPVKYAISGKILGLANGEIRIKNNVTNEEKTFSNSDLVGNFFNLNTVVTGDYTLAISGQPKGQKCDFINGSEMVKITNSDVSTLEVSCKNLTYKVSGKLSGLAHGSLTIENRINNATTGQSLILTQDGVFSFEAPKVAHGSNYEVLITQSTNGQHFCSVKRSDGVVDGSDVSNIEINCKDIYVVPYKVSGTVDTPKNVTLVLNVRGKEKSFSLTQTQSAYELGADFPNGNYTVIIVGADNNLTCSFDAGLSFKTVKVDNSDATVGAITCTAPSAQFPVNSKITGLKSGIVLSFNGSTALIEPNNTNEVSTELANLPVGTNYVLSIAQQPQGQACQIEKNMGKGIVDKEIAINIICSDSTMPTYRLSGEVQTDYDISLTFNVNGQEKTVNVTKDKSTFELGDFSDGNYTVNWLSTNSAVSCVFDNGRLFSNINIVGKAAKLPRLICETKADHYPVTIKFFNLKEKAQLVIDGYILDIGASDIEKTLTQKATGTSYRVSINIQPEGQSCELSGNHSGTIAEQPIEVTMNCVDLGLIFEDSFE